ncbi:MAG TPA: Lrp/AsnC ligand binding domain-containing protein [Methanothrix sp.]|nr:Lrp/AsnC ligand binding domain-containing protein [Methanothrix sp.]
MVPVYGEHDFIAIADVESISDLNRAVLNIREIPGISYTQTILGMELRL